MLNNQQIFEAWLAGKLTTAECEQQLQSDSEWYGRFLTAQQLQRQAKAPSYAPVPDIDTSQMFRQQWGHKTAKTAWWPRLSVGMSAMALIISISPLQLQLQDGALALSWKKSRKGWTVNRFPVRSAARTCPSRSSIPRPNCAPACCCATAATAGRYAKAGNAAR